MHSDLARAIAEAEGFGVFNAIPTLANNPGDLELGDVGFGVYQGRTIVFKSESNPKPSGVTIFPDAVSGWAALEHELTLILSGKSTVYKPTMTIAEMAKRWTQTEQSQWALNVCDGLAKCGRMAATTTTLSAVLG